MMRPMSLRTSEYKHIAIDAKGRPVIVEMPRLKVRDLVMAHLAHGWPAEELVRQFQGLTLAQAYGALSYYWDHQADVDQDIQRVRELDREFEERQKDEPVVKKIRKLLSSRRG